MASGVGHSGAKFVWPYPESLEPRWKRWRRRKKALMEERNGRLVGPIVVDLFLMVFCSFSASTAIRCQACGVPVVR